jgi:hypothetical protein
VVECVASTVCESLGLETSGSSIPHMTGWSKGDELGRYGELIDRLARRIEDALLDVEPPQGDRGDGAAAPVSRLRKSTSASREAVRIPHPRLARAAHASTPRRGFPSPSARFRAFGRAPYLGSSNEPPLKGGPKWRT